MEVAHYALLGFLPLAALPIVLHLLTLHRLKTVELPTFRFLMDSYVQQRRRMQFLEALLAFLRTLFLLVLILAFARPMSRSWAALFPGGSGRDVVMLFDASASMNAASRGKTAMDRAKGVAVSLVESLGADDRLTIIRVANRPEEDARKFASDAKGLRDKIDAITVGPSRANMAAALSQVYGASGGKSAKPVVYLFSDSQAGSWREMRDPSSAKVVPAGAKLTIVHVGGDAAIPNRAIVGDPPGKARAVVGLPFTLRVRASGDMKGGDPTATIGVSIDEHEIARLPVTIRPGEAVSRSVVFVPEAAGVVRGRFDITGKTADGFPDDDSYLFTLTVDPQIKVLLVNGIPTPDPFDNEGLYLRTAMTARGDDGKSAGPLAATQAIARSLDLREIPESGLTQEALRDVSVVVLANCGGLNAQHFAWVRDHVAAGAGLLILPGDRVNPDAYNTQFLTIPGPRKERLIGVNLGPPEGDPDKPETFERLAAIDFAHPALAVFDDPDGRFLRTAHLGRRFPLVAPDGAPANAWPLAQYASGKPAMAEGRYGDGIVILAGFPANAKWSNLPLKPEFVPLVLRLVAYAQGRATLDVTGSVPPGGSADIGVPADWNPVSGVVTDPARKATTLAFERSNSRMVAPFDATTARGYYSVDVKGGRVEQPKTGSSAFAVNIAAEESRFAPVSEDTLRGAMPNADLTFVNASAEAQQSQGKIGERREVWRPLILLLFGIIGAEFLLSTLGGSRARRSAEETPGPGTP